MLKAFIDKILDLAPVEVLTLMGRPYTDRGIVPTFGPTATAIKGHTLTGIKAFMETEKPQGSIVHIKEHHTVALVSPLFGPFRQRETLMESENSPNRFTFGNWYDLETMTIQLQACFVQTETTKVLLAIIGNLADGTVSSFNDDGTSQSVTVKAGITKKGTAAVPNPVMLAPFRTFPEIEQPESPFVFRLRPTGAMPQAAIFEADGGAWKNECIRRISAWFAEQMPGVPVIA